MEVQLQKAQTPKPPKSSQDENIMVSKTLVRQIEAHSDQLLREVLSRMKEDNRVFAYWALPESELREAAGNVFANLGEWLTSRTDSAISERYRRIGGLRSSQKIPLSQVLCAFVIVKSTLLDFVRGSVVGGPGDLELERELLLSIADFFDKAMCSAAAGYEDAKVDQAGFSEPQKVEPRPHAGPRRAATPDKSEWDPTSRAGEVGEVSG